MSRKMAQSIDDFLEDYRLDVHTIREFVSLSQGLDGGCDSLRPLTPDSVPSTQASSWMAALSSGRNSSIQNNEVALIPIATMDGRVFPAGTRAYPAAADRTIFFESQMNAPTKTNETTLISSSTNPNTSVKPGEVVKKSKRSRMQTEARYLRRKAQNRDAQRRFRERQRIFENESPMSLVIESLKAPDGS